MVVLSSIIRGYQILLPKCSDTGALYINIMALFFDQIVTKFTHKSLPVIYSKPYYQNIH